MSVKSCSDQEFIRLFREHQSTKLVAQVLGISEKNVRRRRKTVERRHNIILPLSDIFGRTAYNVAAISDDRVEVKFNIKDGIVLVAGDQHYHPSGVPVMHKAMVYFAKKLKPFAIVWNGDACDFPSISRHPSIGYESYPTVKQELDVIRERSEEIIKASPNSKRVWNLGNHCMRFNSRLAAVAPEYSDVKGMHLKHHIPGWIPAWFVTVNEGQPSHTEIRHREKGGVHAGYNNTKESGVNIVTGHDHRADVVAYDDRRGRRYSVRHGMTADSCRDPQFVNYLEGRKTNWQSAMAILTYKDGVLLQPELALRFDDNSFQFRGEIIKV